MKNVLISLCLLALAALSFGGKKKDEVQIGLDPSGTLYVQIIDSVGLSYMNRNNRFREIKSTLEDVLTEADFPMQVEIVKFGANRVPPEIPRLDLTIMRWGDNGFGEIEARFSASLKYEYDRNGLGVFKELGGSATVFSSERQRRNYNEVLGKAFVRMISELNQRLPMSSDEDEEPDLPPESNPYVRPGLIDSKNE